MARPEAALLRLLAAGPVKGVRAPECLSARVLAVEYVTVRWAVR